LGGGPSSERRGSGWAVGAEVNRLEGSNMGISCRSRSIGSGSGAGVRGSWWLREDGGGVSTGNGRRILAWGGSGVLPKRLSAVPIPESAQGRTPTTIQREAGLSTRAGESTVGASQGCPPRAWRVERALSRNSAVQISICVASSKPSVVRCPAARPASRY
jgi:hypothetical protein